jgi:hypothetical protein
MFKVDISIKEWVINSSATKKTKSIKMTTENYVLSTIKEWRNNFAY